MICYNLIMFYFGEFNGQRVLKSDFIEGANAFFTFRENSKPQNCISPEQTHSDNIEVIDNRTEYPNTDGLIVTSPGKAICLKFADCTPLIFYNPKTRIGAISHAGWRGTAAQIGVKTIKKMGGDAKDIIAVIGPSIGLCCYEVSEDVKEKLLKTVTSGTGLIKGNHVDLKGINARQLSEAGVKNIDICPYCTSCDNDLFYSYRKENGTAERHYAYLKL